MKLKSNNIFAIYYRWIYDELPHDICTFFWGTLFIILFAPIFIPGRLIGDHYDHWTEYFGKGFMFYLVFLLVAAVGAIPLSKEFLQSMNVFLGILLCFVLGVAIISVLTGIGFLIYYVVRKRKEQLKGKGQESVLEKTGHFVGAIRGKYCTKITWL